MSDFTRSPRFLQAKHNFFNYLVTVLGSTDPSLFIQQIFFGWFQCVYNTVQTHKVYISELDYIVHYLHDFQITYRMKQCTTCQHTNYHDTTNHSGYLLWSCSINKIVPTKILLNFLSPFDEESSKSKSNNAGLNLVELNKQEELQNAEKEKEMIVKERKLKQKVKFNFES